MSKNEPRDASHYRNGFSNPAGRISELEHLLEFAQKEIDALQLAKRDLQSELTAARDEAEKLRARVEELEDFCADKIGRLPLPGDRTRFADGRYTAFREVYEEAQRLRQQADDLDNV